MPPFSGDITAEIERYLRTGETDPHRVAWSGATFIDCERKAHEDLIGALVAEVGRRSRDQTTAPALRDMDLVAFTRGKIEPMVRGLFPRAEQDAVLSLVERSVVFLTPENIEPVLRECSWLGSIWDIANLYLGSIGAELLGEDAPVIVGLNLETTCYVSPTYFEDDDPYADFVVHEVAHIFHNCRRRTAGLRETRRREFLLNIDFHRRETFAYACEAYARIVERAPRLAERVALAKEFGREVSLADDRVEAAEVADIVREASGRRNGWKVILARCAPPKTSPRPRR